MKAVIFDFDGVIHNTFDFHRKKIKDFFGIDLSKQDFEKIHECNFFKNKNGSIKNIDWTKYPNFIYDEISNLNVQNDIRDVLFKLNERYNLFIVSSGGTKNINDYLGNNGIITIFREVLGLEFDKSKVNKFKYLFDKYNLTPDNCLFVTDTLGDIIEANEVNLKTVAVDFGYHGRETLKKGNPYKIISKMDELLLILK
ncbi:MAG: HAD family hydrolase [Nanoarchaeota archaeon]